VAPQSEIGMTIWYGYSGSLLVLSKHSSSIGQRFGVNNAFDGVKTDRKWKSMLDDAA
jgi:hypothetical protein